MRHLAIAILFIVALSTKAQIEYHATDLATFGDSIPVLRMTLEDSLLHLDEVDPDGWNFSNLTPGTNDTAIVFRKAELPSTDSFPDETMFIRENEEVYLATILDGNILKMVGFLVVMENDQTLPMVFAEPITTLVFPLEVGYEHATTKTFEIAGTPEDFFIDTLDVDSMKFVIDMTATLCIESIGTVQTFRYSFDAFKSSETNIMAIDLYVKVPYIGWIMVEDDIVSDSTKSLRFFNPNFGTPLCEVNMNWNDTIVNFKMIDTEGEFIRKPVNASVNIFPNPVNHGSIYFDQIISDIQIIDISGRTILTFKGNTSELVVPETLSGIFFCKYRCQNSDIEVQKVVIQ